jgi:hypothetical protein
MKSAVAARPQRCAVIRGHFLRIFAPDGPVSTDRDLICDPFGAAILRRQDRARVVASSRQSGKIIFGATLGQVHVCS